MRRCAVDAPRLNDAFLAPRCQRARFNVACYTLTAVILGAPVPKAGVPVTLNELVEACCVEPDDFISLTLHGREVICRGAGEI